jgi:hypothetical protein
VSSIPSKVAAEALAGARREATFDPHGRLPVKIFRSGKSQNIKHRAGETFLRKVDAGALGAGLQITRDLRHFPAFLTGNEIRGKNQTIGEKLLDSPENREHNARW